MTYQLSIGTKTLIILGLIWFSFMSLYTGLALVANYFSAYQYQVIASGVAADVHASPNGSTFHLRQGNITSSQAFYVPVMIQEGDQVFITSVSDSIDFPILHPRRTWVEVYVNGNLAHSTKPIVSLVVAVGLWVATLSVISVAYYRNKRKIKPRREEVITA